MTRGSSSNPYQEDLSRFRTKHEFVDDRALANEAPKEKAGGSSTTPSQQSGTEKTTTVDRELSSILQTMNQQNKSVKFMPGFRIQLYVGNIRSEADGAKTFIYRSFPELAPYITFSQPTYRVKAGDFMSKAEAEHTLASIKVQYPTAMIIQDKIEIEKGLLQAIADK